MMQSIFFAPIVWLIMSLGMILFSCEKFEPRLPPENEVLDGTPEDLSFDQNARFVLGDVAFNTEIFTFEKGLGPTFVATSCASCHAGDGKGTPFTTLTRFGQVDDRGNLFLDKGGPQLQNRAIPGYQPEQIPNGATFSKFTPPAVTGLGFLQYVNDQYLLNLSDPNDTNGDGISGVPNWQIPVSYAVIPSNAVEKNGKYIHRFGKKAAVYDLLNQTVNAYNEDMGITSTFNPKDVYSGLTIDPEVSDATIRSVVDYLLLLKAPMRRNVNNPNVVAGEKIFSQINCSGCHIPKLKTGDAPIFSLSNKEFYPYSDLLLHDMGPGLDDGYTEGSAKTFEWRTPPLWGLGLSKSSQGGSYFLLHDGRAKSIEDAILMHGGEAEKSKSTFEKLSKTEQINLIKFLESL